MNLGDSCSFPRVFHLEKVKELRRERKKEERKEVQRKISKIFRFNKLLSICLEAAPGTQ